MPTYHHDRLAVYRAAVSFVAHAAAIVPSISPAQAHLRSQLARAATSIALSIAEGSGEFARAEKAKFYRYARRSATECAAVLDVLQVVGYRNGAQLKTGREMLNEIVAMLTTMTKGLSDSALDPDERTR